MELTLKQQLQNHDEQYFLDIKPHKQFADETYLATKRFCAHKFCSEEIANYVTGAESETVVSTSSRADTMHFWLCLLQGTL